MRRRIIKELLLMFFVELKPIAYNKNINFLLQYKVKFEQSYVRYEVLYFKYQRYRHIKNFCFQQDRCVKCIEDYATEKCSKKTKFRDVK